MAVIINGDTGIDKITDGSVSTADLASTLDLSGKTMTYGNLPAANLTGTLPAINGSSLTNLPEPSELSTASGSAPSYSARAWVNFKGTSTVTIRDSGNVSSITDNGTGNYNVNFTTAMPDADYSTVTALNYNNSTFVTNIGATVKLPTTSKIEIETGGSSNNAIDMHTINVAVFR